MSVDGFQEPLDLARCRFEGTAGLAAHEFEVTVEDAVSPDFDPLQPQVVIIPE